MAECPSRFRPNVSSVRSVPVPAVSPFWIGGILSLFVTLVFDVPMLWSLVPKDTAFNIWLDGVPYVLPAIPMSWASPTRLDFQIIGLGGPPAVVTVEFPDYDPLLRWKVGNLVDPFGPTDGIVF